MPIELLAVMPGATTFNEMWLHGQFAALRQHGEWFTDDGVIRAHIDELVEWKKAERPKRPSPSSV